MSKLADVDVAPPIGVAYGHVISQCGADWRRGRVVDPLPIEAPLVVALNKSHFNSSLSNDQKLIDSVNSKKKKKKKKKSKEPSR